MGLWCSSWELLWALPGGRRHPETSYSTRLASAVGQRFLLFNWASTGLVSPYSRSPSTLLVSSTNICHFNIHFHFKCYLFQLGSNQPTWSKIGHQRCNWHRFTWQQKFINPRFLLLASVTLTFTFTLYVISFNWGQTNLKPNWASTLQLAPFHLTAKAHQSSVSSCICHFLTTKPLFFIMANQDLWAFKYHPLAWSHA